MARASGMTGRGTSGLRAVVLTAAVVALAFPMSASAASLSGDGKIAFTRFNPATFQTRNLHRAPKRRGGSPFDLWPRRQCPVWSPKGRRIAFDRGGDIWVMDAWGHHLHQLTTSPAGEGQPTWSPDGKTLAFTSNRAGGDAWNIYTLHRTRPYGRAVAVSDDVSGSGCGLQGAQSPSYGPDGSLWWTETCFPPDYDSEVTEIVHLSPPAATPTVFPTDYSTGVSIDVSPLGTALLDNPSSDGQAWIDRYDLPGGQRIRITSVLTDSGSPASAPSGQRIAYAHHPRLPRKGSSSPPTPTAPTSASPSGREQPQLASR